MKITKSKIRRAKVESFVRNQVGDKNVDLIADMVAAICSRHCGHKTDRKQQTRKPEQRGTRAKDKIYTTGGMHNLEPV